MMACQRWVWTVTLVLAGCARPMPVPMAQTPSNPGWTGPAPAVEVYPEDAPEHLRIQDTAALVHARWQGTTPTDVQRVEFITPSGRVYETQVLPLGQSGDAVARLALGGTFVEEYRLTGMWKARVYINAGTAPVREVEFEVLP